MLGRIGQFTNISDFLIYLLEMLLAILVSITFHEYAHAAVAVAIKAIKRDETPMDHHIRLS